MTKLEEEMQQAWSRDYESLALRKEKLSKTSFTLVTRPWPSDYSQALQEGQDALVALPDDVMVFHPSGKGESSPGLHLTAAEFKESWSRVVAAFDQLFTEEIQEGFDRWMLREGVS